MTQYGSDCDLEPIHHLVTVVKQKLPKMDQKRFGMCGRSTAQLEMANRSRRSLQARPLLRWLALNIAGFAILWILSSINDSGETTHITIQNRYLQVFTLPKYNADDSVSVFFNNTNLIYGNELKRIPKKEKTGKLTQVSFLFGLDRVNRTKTLELVHITKTGGSALEMGAASAGIRWGACHFVELPLLGCSQPPDWPLPDSVELPDFLKSKTHSEPWHSPPHWLVPNPQPKDRFANFAVVRNPYDRTLSEFYCSAFGINGGKNFTTESEMYGDVFPHTFGTWIADKLHEETDYYGHLLPQNYFVYDYNTGERMVDHVLRYEELEEQFAMLMFLYGLDIKIPDREVSQSTTLVVSKSSRLTVNDMSPDTIQLINDHYKLDFDLFGYEMIDVNKN